MSETPSVYSILSKVEFKDFANKKKSGNKDLSYLPWPIAWGAVAERYPDANYEVLTFGDGCQPFTYDPATGYMVHTRVTIGGITRSMWLPVMDMRNCAMKSEAYEVTTKNGKFTVPPATMADINRAIMRCLVKNLAMFGLGLNYYAGNDDVLVNIGSETEYITKEDLAGVRNTMKEMGWKDENSIAKYFKIPSLDKMTTEDLLKFTKMVEDAKAKAADKGNVVQDIDSENTENLPEN